MLYGRDSERSRIGEILDGARGSRSAVLVLRGEAGVGKSALLEDARAQAGDMRVLSGRGIESEAQLPYAGLHQLLRPILGDLDKLPAPQARALRAALGLDEGVSDEWFLVSLGVLSLLAEAAESGPLLCLVDDAHWLDDASAESLIFAGRRLEAERVAILFAARDGDVRSFEAPEFEELRLAGLDAGSADALLEQRSTAPLSREARTRLIEGTGGNPLALLELSASLSEEQLLAVEPLPVSARVEGAFLEQVRTLPEATQTLLLVAATDDAGEPATVLRAAARLGAGAEALDAAERAALLRVDGLRLEFRHPLIRSAVYHGAPLSKRHAAHRALAAVLDADAGADRRAWHRATACVEPDPDVVEELENAARRARRRSGFVAASLAFERAAVLATDGRRRTRLLIDAAESAWFAGRPERAKMLLERALPLAGDPAERAEIASWRALIEVNVGVPADACELLMSSAPDMAAVDAERGLYMLSVAIVAAGYTDDRDAGGAIAELAEHMPVPDTPVARFLAHFLHGSGAFFAQDFEAAAPSLRAALELADEADAAGSLRLLGLLLIAGGAGLFVGDDVAAQRLNRRLVTFARDTGALTLLTQALPRLALTQIPNGQWPAARAALEEGVQLARQIGQHQVVGHMLAELALLAALRGDAEECRSQAALAAELASGRRLMHVGHTVRWALLVLELGERRPDEAFLHAREITTLPVVLRSALDRIEAAVRTGATETARTWLETLASWADSSGAPWALAVAQHCRALLCADEDEAERFFAAALEIHAGARRPFDRARTELAFGEWLRRARRRVEAREHLRAALDGFEALGATAWAERARIELRASGQTARKRDASTRDELTAQELQIAGYVAEGLSNRDVAAQLFLSPRTIDYHLRNVFRKLGISSRRELARLDLAPAAAPGPKLARV